MQPKKQLKVQYNGIFEEILFLLTKKALLERGSKNPIFAIRPQFWSMTHF